MTITQAQLQKIAPNVSLSKIIIEGRNGNNKIAVELEKIRPLKIADSQVIGTGVAFLSTDEDISLINNLQQQFETKVRNGSGFFDIKDIEVATEKVLQKQEKKFLSKTYKIIETRSIQENNFVVFYGSWYKDSSSGEYTFSKVQAEVIIQDGKVKSESSLFLLKNEPNNTIWDGPIKKSQDQLSYVTDEQQPRQLEKRTVRNYKVQDFRTKDSIAKILVDYQEINNRILNAKKKQILAPKKSRKKYFTESYIVQKQDVSFSFGVDIKQAIVENSFFSKDPQTPDSLKDSLLRNSKIKLLKVLRRKVEEISGNSGNRLTDYRKSVKSFPGHHEVEVANSHETATGFINTGNLKENLSVIPRIEEKMRFFTCVDKDTGKEQNGIYQYGVKIEILDGSYEIVDSDIITLTNNRNALRQIANRLSMIVDKGIVTNIHSEQQIESYVDKYMNILEKYYQLDTALNSNMDIKNSLVAQLSPITLSVGAFDNFINLHESLISNLEQITKEKNTIVLEKYFEDNIYDFSLANLKKVEYFPSNNSTFFNEYDFSSLSFSDDSQIIKNSAGVPILTLVPPFSISYEDAVSEMRGQEKRKYGYGKEKSFDRIIRQNIVRHVNIEIAKLNNERADYDPELAEMYKYFSSTNVDNKEIDEVFDLYENYKDDFLASVQYLSDYDYRTSREDWQDLSNLTRIEKQILDRKGYLVCRLAPNRRDYRHTKWNISHNLKSIDVFFMLQVENLEDLIASFSSFYDIGQTPTPPTPPPAPIENLADANNIVLPSAFQEQADTANNMYSVTNKAAVQARDVIRSTRNPLDA